MDTVSKTLKSQPLKGDNSEAGRKARLEFLSELGLETSCYEENRLQSSEVKSNVECFIGCYELCVFLTFGTKLKFLS